MPYKSLLFKEEKAKQYFHKTHNPSWATWEKKKDERNKSKAYSSSSARIADNFQIQVKRWKKK